MFPTVGFCAKKILGLVGSQIEVEKIFLLARILTNLRGCHLQLKNLDKLIFVNKNSPYDPKIDYKSPFSLANFIESAFNLEKKLEEFEGASKRDKVVEL
jgi:hypothetical protein